jgi:hypothetical protein
MDLLGFFEEKIGYLEIKIRLTPLNRLSRTGSPRSGSDAARLPAARVWLGRHWLPQAIPRRVVRHGTVWARMWSQRGRLSRSGSRRTGCGYARMWSPVHNMSL